MPTQNWREHWRLNMFPLRIIYLLRSGAVTDWYGLCEAIDVPTMTTPSYHLEKMLNHLAAAGLVTLKLAEGGSSHNFTISLTPTWQNMQSALEISLSDLAKFPPSRAIYVRPFYPKPVIPKEEQIPDVFVLMSFERSMKIVYERSLKEAAQSVQLSIARADDLKTLEHIMDDVWKHIYAARFIIADCTHGNPNVFYEMGIAHTLGKPVLVITQTPKMIPFDIKQVRYVTYKNTGKGLQELTGAVRSFLEEVNK